MNGVLIFVSCCCGECDGRGVDTCRHGFFRRGSESLMDVWTGT